MSVIVSISDFVGIYAISSNSLETALIQAEIDEIEETWLNNLLGLTDATAFLAECAGNGGVPTSANYLTIFNALQLENTCSDFETYSTGVKKMILAAVYSEHYKNKLTVGTTIGKQTIQASNSKTSTDIFALKNMYNKAVNNYRTIQKYIYQNSSDFPDFKGINKNYTTPF